MWWPPPNHAMRCRAILFRSFAHTGPHAKPFHAPYHGRPDQTRREFDLTRPKQNQNQNQGGKDGAYDLVLCMQCHVSQIGLTLAVSGGDFASKSRLSECHNNRTFEHLNPSTFPLPTPPGWPLCRALPSLLRKGKTRTGDLTVRPSGDQGNIWYSRLRAPSHGPAATNPELGTREDQWMHDVHGVMYDCIDAGTDVCRGVGVARELGTGGGGRGARLKRERDGGKL